MRKTLSLLLSVLIAFEPMLFAAVRGKEVRYVGGSIAGLKENTEGRLALDDGEAVFTDKKAKDRLLAIPYNKIDSLEYGQKAGRRVGVAVAVSPLFLFSKKRKHFLTIGFFDADSKKQGAVFELSKGIVKETLTVLEQKSGKTVEYESEEARKQVQK